MIKKVEMNDYAEKMSSENLFIVCGEGNGFEANLTDLLNDLEEINHSEPSCDVKKLTEQIEFVYYLGLEQNKNLIRRKLSSGKLVRAMDFCIRTQNVKIGDRVLVTDFVSTKDIDYFNPDLAKKWIYLTPQQNSTLEKDNIILFGAAGTGKTALIKAKVIKLVHSGSDKKIIIIPSADSNCANYEEFIKIPKLEIWTPKDLENKSELGDIVKVLHEIYAWM